MTRSLAALAVFGAALIFVACGSGDNTDARPAPPVADFPATDGRTLEEILADVKPSDLVVSHAGQVFDKGVNRYPFGVFTVGGEQVKDADVALYFAPGDDGRAIGPFPAHVESLSSDAAFVAESTAADPETATVAYVAEDVRFDRNGEWRVAALVRNGGTLEGTRIPSAVVGDFAEVPDAGDKAPLIHTPTREDVADLSEIDTRVPHDTMHEVDYADAYGERPIVLMFATPALCQSRVCGPVVDIQEQVASEFGNEAAFIHMEVYEDNDPNKGLRDQLKAFHLPTEPWVFVIDDQGVIRSRIEGPVSVESLEHVVREVL